MELQKNEKGQYDLKAILGPEAENVSDGYHTFKELYDHRIALYMALCNIISQLGTGLVWKSQKHADGEPAYDGWFVLGLFTEPGRQISYHLPMSQWGKCYFAEEMERSPSYDGHTSEDVLARLSLLV